jgi:hypothetical protein
MADNKVCPDCLPTELCELHRDATRMTQQIDRSFLGFGPVLARCMGKDYCKHLPGTCTATACSKHGLLQPDGKCAMCELDKAQARDAAAKCPMAHTEKPCNFPHCDCQPFAPEQGSIASELPMGTCLLCKGTGRRLFPTVDGGYMGDCECRGNFAEFAPQPELVAPEASAALFMPTYEESAVIRSLAQDQDLSESAVIRQALRLYQLNHKRLKDGETLSYSGDAERAREFATQPELVTEADSTAVFKDKFAGSLESMAGELDEAIEVFAADHEITGSFMVTASWLKRTAKAIRDSKVL